MLTRGVGVSKSTVAADIGRWAEEGRRSWTEDIMLCGRSPSPLLLLLLGERKEEGGGRGRGVAVYVGCGFSGDEGNCANNPAASPKLSFVVVVLFRDATIAEGSSLISSRL